MWVQFATLGLAIILQLVGIVVFATKMNERTHSLEKITGELAEGQAQIHGDLSELLQALTKREVAEQRTVTKIETLEAEVSRLREWRHNFGQTEWAQLTTVCLRLEEMTKRMLMTEPRNRG
jgi:hypothetical protein